MAYGSVFASQLCFVIAQSLLFSQPPKKVINDFTVDVELANMAPDVLFFRVSEEIQLSLVRPENCAVWSNPAQGEHSIFYEVSKLMFPEAQSFFRQFALRDFGLEQPRIRSR